MIEQIVAYDVRYLISDWAFPYQPERRHLFFLRDDIQQPYSTDDMVWVSVLNRYDDLPAWRGTVQNLWQELGEMDTFFAAHGGYPASTLRIVITIVLQDEQEALHWEGYDFKPMTAAFGGQLLGYDVSDRFLLSGLSNCAYDEDELVALKPVWSPHLNELHLFTDVDKAHEFKALTSDRVKGHAPFFVFGLYTLDSYAE
ncbi:MAG: hypothetical protein J0M33_24595 [Anaerolineae bacterium]|nr:hypothetical protein [Anaerolineae bacterium]